MKRRIPQVFRVSACLRAQINAGANAHRHCKFRLLGRRATAFGLGDISKTRRVGLAFLDAELLDRVPLLPVEILGFQVQPKKNR